MRGVNRATAETLAAGLRRRQLALTFTVMLHLSALACIVLLHVHAPLSPPEPPPLEVVMITPPERPPDALPEPLRPPVPAADALRPQAASTAMPPKPAQVRPLPTVPAAAQAPEPPAAAAVSPPTSTSTPTSTPTPTLTPTPTPTPVVPALDPVARPAAPAGTAAPAAGATPAAASATAAARGTSVVPPSFDADYLHNPPPRYPPAAARLRESGRVLLSVAVNAAGLPERVEIASSSGSPRLDQAALDTVKRWRFVPARQGDKPVAASVTVPLVFRLDEQAP